MGNMDNPFVVDDEAFSCEAEFYACYPNYKFPEEIEQELRAKWSKYKLNKVFRDHYRNTFDSGKGERGHLNKCDLEDIGLSTRQLRGFKFEKCSMTDSFFETCNLDGAEFDHCQLRDSSFQDCMMKMTNFSGSHLVGCSFYNCDLFEARLKGCDISETKFVECLGDGVHVKTFFADSEIVNYTAEKIFMVDDIEFEISDLYENSALDLAEWLCMHHKDYIEPFAEWLDKQKKIFEYHIDTNPAEPTI